MGMTTYSGNAVLNHFLRGAPLTAPTRVFVSLHTAAPGDTGANEVSTVAWPSYARQDPAAGDAIATGFDLSTAKATENAKQMLFPQHNGAGNVVVTHFAIWDAATSGNCIVVGSLNASKTVAPSDELVIYPDELDVTAS